MYILKIFGFGILYVSMNIGVKTKSVLLGIFMSIMTLFLNSIFLYYASGLYTIEGASLLELLSWLLTYYPLYIIGFSLSSGIFIGVFTYYRPAIDRFRIFSGISILGGFVSIVSSLFFLCCAPYMVIVLSVLGSYAFSMIYVSRWTALAGISIQIASTALIIYFRKRGLARCRCEAL